MTDPDACAGLARLRIIDPDACAGLARLRIIDRDACAGLARLRIIDRTLLRTMSPSPSMLRNGSPARRHYARKLGDAPESALTSRGTE